MAHRKPKPTESQAGKTLSDPKSSAKAKSAAASKLGKIPDHPKSRRRS